MSPRISLAVFSYNRPDKTKACLEALSQNSLEDLHHIYCFIDGPRTLDDQNKINEVEKTIQESEICSIQTIRSKENKGCAKSIIQGLTSVFQESDSIIVVEDDLVVHPDFIEYMVYAIKHHLEKDNVLGISGYGYIHHHSNYRLPLSSSWGWATSKSVWNTMEWNTSKVIEMIDTDNRKFEFDFGGYGYLKMLKNQSLGLVDSWAIRFYANLFVQRGYFIYPAKTLVKNMGFDNSGTHLRAPNFMKENKPLVRAPFEKKLDLSKSAEETVRALFASNLKTNRKSKIKNLIFNIKKRLSTPKK